jgi:hypothetical protein
VRRAARPEGDSLLFRSESSSATSPMGRDLPATWQRRLTGLQLLSGCSARPGSFLMCSGSLSGNIAARTNRTVAPKPRKTTTTVTGSKSVPVRSGSANIRWNKAKRPCNVMIAHT